MGLPNFVPYTSSKCMTVNDCHLNSAYFNFSLFCLAMAIILAINLTKTLFGMKELSYIQ